MPRKSVPIPWDTKIIGYGEHPVADLLANPTNWRRHPPAQLAPLLGVLQTVGVVQNLLVNKRASMAWPETERGQEVLVDGHARVLLAKQHGQPVLPVTYVELTPNEEAQILLMLDPLVPLAESDQDALRVLLQQVQSEDAAVQAFLAQLAEEQGLFPEVPPTLDELGQQYGDPTDDAFYKTITIRVSQEIWAQYQEVMAGLPGEDEAAKFAALLDAVA